MLIIALLYLTDLSHSQSTLRTAYSPPSVAINLDESASTRWKPAVDAILSRQSFEASFMPVFASHNESLFNNITQTQTAAIASSIEQHFPEQAAELRGISTAFAAHGYHVSFEYLSLWVWFHELAHSDAASDGLSKAQSRSCTGILLKCSCNNRVVHARNMDQSPMEARRLALKLNFLARNATIFTGVDWYWFTTGVMTAVKPNVVTLEENWRFTPVVSSQRVVQEAAQGTLPQVFAFRHFLSGNLSPEQVVASLGTTPFAVGMYLIASTGEDGLVITRSADAYNTTRLNGRNFVVQTNYDRWLPDPSTDPRRTYAEAILSNTATSASLEGCFLHAYATVTSPHVKVPDTAYTVTMSVDQGLELAMVWDHNGSTAKFA
eukprot:TRINITY_DN10380_c0_g2_i2.p1 TRINITY_DN10380_c0_g2~~TRINITY_DN10380_c0_g2_i2.p1  ORF type:complete len:378 (+),score=54.00 TRINITY_DN10380_c0_g2_i2:253-1386(+)